VSGAKHASDRRECAPAGGDRSGLRIDGANADDDGRYCRTVVRRIQAGVGY
jgi:hypothetical protein